MHAQTKANLLTALHGEAFAYAKYILYAEHAVSRDAAILPTCSKQRRERSCLSILPRRPS